MSDALLIAIIVSLGPTLVGIAALVKMFRGFKEIHLSMNSRLDELLALTRTTAHAEGVKEEKEREKWPH